MALISVPAFMGDFLVDIFFHTQRGRSTKNATEGKGHHQGCRRNTPPGSAQCDYSPCTHYCADPICGTYVTLFSSGQTTQLTERLLPLSRFRRPSLRTPRNARNASSELDAGFQPSCASFPWGSLRHWIPMSIMYF